MDTSSENLLALLATLVLLPLYIVYARQTARRHSRPLTEVVWGTTYRARPTTYYLLALRSVAVIILIAVAASTTDIPSWWLGLVACLILAATTHPIIANWIYRDAASRDLVAAREALTAYLIPVFGALLYLLRRTRHPKVRHIEAPPMLSIAHMLRTWGRFSLVLGGFLALGMLVAWLAQLLQRAGGA